MLHHPYYFLFRCTLSPRLNWVQLCKYKMLAEIMTSFAVKTRLPSASFRIFTASFEDGPLASILLIVRSFIAFSSKFDFDFRSWWMKMEWNDKAKAKAKAINLHPHQTDADGLVFGFFNDSDRYIRRRSKIYRTTLVVVRGCAKAMLVFGLVFGLVSSQCYRSVLIFSYWRQISSD